MVDRAVHRPMAFRQPARSLEHRSRQHSRGTGHRDRVVPLQSARRRYRVPCRATYPALLVVFLGAPRLAYRYWEGQPLRSFRARAGQTRPGRSVPDAPAKFWCASCCARTVTCHLGFLDDNAALRGAKVHWVPVLGGLGSAAPAQSRGLAAETLLIAMPSASNAQMQRVVEACGSSRASHFAAAPRLQDVVSGRMSFNELKGSLADPEDLLGRDPGATWPGPLSASACPASASWQPAAAVRSVPNCAGRWHALALESLTILELSEYNFIELHRN